MGVLSNKKTGAFWTKDKPTNKVWFLQGGEDNIIFSFDRVHVFHLFGDYPDKLTKEQKAIFDKENPYWRDYFLGKV